ncbi:MAG: DUF29 domain-containing protein [Dolichospermum sp. DET50]|nr:DUF29 domain-containing protein [Dolichospermum sp. DET66]MBS3030888.1 DUF29 domain-containing protein [Dolichospermum sp. DET67]MBS3036098.1 DUF29 domain-containing protein [Dolichospermum sp. DET50]QSX68175.1 MAG: DUF29 domain-containing protein [Dolichospermum sp. DET69]
MKVTTNLQQLYETDNYFWLLETIDLLKQGRLDELDLENLIEELESLAKRDQHKVKSLLEQVIRHLLLLQYWANEYDRNKNHWRSEIRSFRVQLKDRLTSNLYNYLLSIFATIYEDALGYVQEKTGFTVNFPTECPYSLEEVLDINYLPN